MRNKTFLVISGVIFLLVSLLHLVRIISGFQVLVGNLLVRIPLWISWIGLVISGYLAYEAFRLSRN